MISHLSTFILGVFATGIGVFINHAFVQHRIKKKHYHDKLEYIFNNIFELQKLYQDCFSSCVEYDFDKYKNSRDTFFNKHKETHHIIYLYFDDLSRVYSSNISPIIDMVNKMESIFIQRKVKDDLSVERDKVSEFLYEDQNYITLQNLFNELYIIVKVKIDQPIKNIDFNKFDKRKILPYYPFINYEE